MGGTGGGGRCCDEGGGTGGGGIFDIDVGGPEIEILLNFLDFS